MGLAAAPRPAVQRGQHKNVVFLVSSHDSNKKFGQFPKKIDIGPKNCIFWPENRHLAHKRALMPPRRPPCKAVNAKPLSFRRPVMMVTIFFEAVHQKWISGQKTAFLGPKRATLGNRGRETARRAAKRPSTGKPKVSRVTSGYGGHVISPVRCV